MQLTPQDIRNQEFAKKTFGGLDTDEVNAFLVQVSSQVEESKRKNLELGDQLRVTREQVERYRQTEQLLQETAVTLQSMLEEKRSEANKEAELIIAEAKARASREVEHIRKEADDLAREVEELKRQKSHFFIRMKSVLKSQGELLEALDFTEETELESFSE
jgi:cell division initiation protein